MTWAPNGCRVKGCLPGSSNFRCMVHARSFAGESAWRTYPPRVKRHCYAQQLSLRLPFAPHYYTTRAAFSMGGFLTSSKSLLEVRSTRSPCRLSFAAIIRHRCVYSRAAIAALANEAVPLNGHGGDHKTEQYQSNDYNLDTPSVRGDNPAYLTARIAQTAQTVV